MSVHRYDGEALGEEFQQFRGIRLEEGVEEGCHR